MISCNLEILEFMISSCCRLLEEDALEHLLGGCSLKELICKLTYCIRRLNIYYVFHPNLPLTVSMTSNSRLKSFVECFLRRLFCQRVLGTMAATAIVIAFSW